MGEATGGRAKAPSLPYPVAAVPRRFRLRAAAQPSPAAFSR